MPAVSQRAAKYTTYYHDIRRSHRLADGIAHSQLGADVVALVSGDDAVNEPAVDCEVVDTVEAGDALRSGVLAAIDAGADDDALQTGVVATPGTTIPALPEPSESDIGPSKSRSETAGQGAVIP